MKTSLSSQLITQEHLETSVSEGCYGPLFSVHSPVATGTPFAIFFNGTGRYKAPKTEAGGSHDRPECLQPVRHHKVCSGRSYRAGSPSPWPCHMLVSYGETALRCPMAAMANGHRHGYSSIGTAQPYTLENATSSHGSPVTTLFSSLSPLTFSVNPKKGGSVLQSSGDP